jgi:hypothetical protein
MSEILYPYYREYSKNRSDANTSMMALLSGSQLAAHLLQLTNGSAMTLSEIFPAVEHSSRFDLRSDRAREILVDSEHNISTVGIPFVISFHEAYISDCIDFANNHGFSISKNGINVACMHQRIFSGLNRAANSEVLEIFQLLRLIRNCLTHSGGNPNENLISSLNQLSSDALELWDTWAKCMPINIIDTEGRLKLNANILFMSFAATKELDRKVNHALGEAISDSEWALVIVEDYQCKSKAIKNSSKWRRGLRGYSRQYYSRLNIRDSDLEAASRHLGYWTAQRWA